MSDAGLGDAAPAAMPMFPLGTVLFPTLFMPLHVFEPRYRALVDACLATTLPEFGVVLISRGSEVGGDDVRTDVGTVARILESAQVDDGRWVLGTVGVRRVRVTRWLDDDPYPRAEVEDWLEPEPVIALEGPYEEAVGLARRAWAMKAELSEPAPRSTTEVSDDPVLGSYQLAALAPFGPADQQRLLSADDATDRLGLLRTLLVEEVDFLGRRLALG